MGRDDPNPLSTSDAAQAILSAIIASSDDAIVSKDLNGIVTSWNPSAERIFGYTAEEMIGRPITTIIPPDRLGEETHIISRIRAGERVDHFETVRQTKSGKLINISVTVSPVHDENGTIIGASKIARDISEQKRYQAEREEELETLEALYRVGQAFTNASDAQTPIQYATDVATELTEAEFGAFFYNATAQNGDKLMLYTLSGVSRDAFEQFPMPRNTDIFAHTFSGNGVLRIDDVTQDPRYGRNAPYCGMPEGHLPVRSYMALPVMARDGHVLGGLFFGHSEPGKFTGRMERVVMAIAAQAATGMENGLLTQQIRTSEERFRLMVESAVDFAIIAINTQGRITSWSHGAERIFGFSADEATGQDFALIFTPEDRESGAAQRELDTARQKGRAEDERWHIRKNGDRFFASGILAAMKNESGDLVGFTKIARDVTAQKEAERALIEARNAAEAANVAKSEFLANMSHEIRTPMNAVIGLANILATSAPLTQKQKEYIHTLQMSADALLALINDLLDIAKIEARSVELERVPFSVMQMIHEVISMLAVRAREKGLFLNVVSDCPCIQKRVFLGDPTRLRQILLNLCSNAVKFTHHGKIDLMIRCTHTDNPEKEDVILTVRDTGIGIEKEKLETIFHKFTQADSSINRKYGGTGLGLAITKTLTEIMGGTISVESEVGKGTSFTVRIPLDIAADNIPSAEAPDALPSFSGASLPRVLVVEDYAPNVLVAGAFLEQFGYTFDVASSGMEAVEKVREKDYALIMMDVQMPGMNGFDTTRYIRELERTSNRKRVPIIGVTAHALSGDRERCLDAGMDEYISKPFDPRDLQSKMSGLLDDEAKA